jgi:hypothetical protein
MIRIYRWKFSINSKLSFRLYIYIVIPLNINLDKSKNLGPLINNPRLPMICHELTHEVKLSYSIKKLFALQILYL